MEENEKRLLREALLKARGNRTKAAELMGVSRRTLHRKIAQWPELDVIGQMSVPLDRVRRGAYRRARGPSVGARPARSTP